MTTTNFRRVLFRSDAVNYYREHFRRQDLPPLEEISGLLALFPNVEIAPEVTSRWPEPWPCVSRQGVYFIFGSRVRLLYIGKASMSAAIGSRLSHWFLYSRPDGGCKVVDPSRWSEEPRFVAALPVPEGMAFEAPALEEFLIDRLSPPDNVNGR